jgi:hypothetical protein
LRLAVGDAIGVGVNWLVLGLGIAVGILWFGIGITGRENLRPLNTKKYAPAKSANITTITTMMTMINLPLFEERCV